MTKLETETTPRGRASNGNRRAKNKPLRPVAVRKPRDLLARLQRARPGTGQRRAAPFAGESAVRFDLGDKPRRVLHDPGCGSPAAGRRRAPEPHSGWNDAREAAKLHPRPYQRLLRRPAVGAAGGSPTRAEERGYRPRLLRGSPQNGAAAAQGTLRSGHLAYT